MAVSEVSYKSPSSSGSSSNEASLFNTSFYPLNVHLFNSFLGLSKNFNVVHINAQSVPAHYSYLFTSLQYCNIHAILISESWLKPSLPSTSFPIPGFHLLRNDRLARVEGGVAIYLRAHISYFILSSSPQPPPNDAVEHFSLEVSFSYSKLLLGVFYSFSLNVDYFSALGLLLDNFINNNKHTIFMGDLNTCLLRNDHRSRKPTSTIESYNFNITYL
ncbi:unnamed protein product [Pieris macdunnoughi]|uniref:Endonuclease/exonuclease/phosphatase domain-containing protein n=1 Tax=Pieris macdunnoughi TaxID=345717 RepID=A0A821KV32_9NEOP|nr:unnamed protein product [Pieris macdunnoughi]